MKTFFAVVGGIVACVVLYLLLVVAAQGTWFVSRSADVVTMNLVNTFSGGMFVEHIISTI